MPVQFGSFVRLLFIVSFTRCTQYSNAFRDAISTNKDTRLMMFTRKEARGVARGSSCFEACIERSHAEPAVSFGTLLSILYTGLRAIKKEKRNTF